MGDPGALTLLPSAAGEPGFGSESSAAVGETTGRVTSGGGGAAEPTNKLDIRAQPVRPLLHPLLAALMPISLPPLLSAGVPTRPAASTASSKAALP